MPGPAMAEKRFNHACTTSQVDGEEAVIVVGGSQSKTVVILLKNQWIPGPDVPSPSSDVYGATLVTPVDVKSSNIAAYLAFGTELYELRTVNGNTRTQNTLSWKALSPLKQYRRGHIIYSLPVSFVDECSASRQLKNH